MKKKLIMLTIFPLLLAVFIQPAIISAEEDIIPPSPPTNVAINDVWGNGTVYDIGWTNPIEEDFDHINIYLSETEGQLGSLKSSVDKESQGALLTGFTSEVIYYFTLRSVDTNGNESTNINQYVTPNATSKPTISNIEVPDSTIRPTEVTVIWDTDIPATSFVYYYKIGRSQNKIWQGNDTLVASHSVRIPNLEPLTTYEYYVSSKNADGNISKSETKIFTTTASAPAGPIILNIQAPNPTIRPTEATVIWDTDIPATSFVWYYELGQSQALTWQGNDTLTTSHSVMIPNLESLTTYEYYVSSKDASGNISRSETKIFTTTAPSTPTPTPTPEPTPTPIPEPNPDVCTTEYNPVCGKDGKTYSNKCFLEKDGVELDYYGKCRTDCANIVTIMEQPTNDKYWEKLGTDPSVEPDILKYKIQWFNGAWSDWYHPGQNDLDWKTNYDGTKRLVWSYFTDHKHEYLKCVKESEQCTDSDSGRNYYEKGITTFGDERKTDSCNYCTGLCIPGEPCGFSCGAVIEYYCDGNSIQSEIYTCPNGCKDGVCVSEEECFKEGEKADGRILTGEKKCCSGLKWILYCIEPGGCLMSGGWCTNCGDGICKSPENEYNCPEDCKEKVCTAEYNPVCGKDGKTYSNKCFLEKDGVELDYYGKCQETVCRISAVCEDGYFAKNTGEKDADGCPIMKCISSDGTSEIDVLRQEIRNLETEIVRIKQEFLNRERSLVQKIDEALTNRLKGKILLQVEEKGEAWYVSPTDEKKHYLGRPDDAFNIMRQLGLGITNADLEKIDIGIANQEGQIDSDNDGLSDALEEGLGTDMNNADTDGDGYSDNEEIIAGYNPIGVGKREINNSLVNRVQGRILLQVEGAGQAWYLNPEDNKRYYLGRPEDAFDIMRGKGLGITNDNLRMIEVGEVD